MYNCSQAFHDAVKNNAPQKALILFGDAVFTNNDINVEEGISFTEVFNSDEDLTPGSAPSAEVSFTLFNDGGILREYEFGEAIVTIGARISIEDAPERVAHETCRVRNNSNPSQYYVCYDTTPYIKLNGSALSVQPSFAPQSIIRKCDSNGSEKMYVFGANDACEVIENGTSAEVVLNAHMKLKAKEWNSKHLGVSFENGRFLYEIDGITSECYEFVPLGVFEIERPKVSNLIELQITANDRMMLFDEDIPEDALTFTSATTIKDVLNQLCTATGVTCITQTFINSTATISSKPKQFETATMRNVIQWIAQAACAMAMFNRDGNLELRWVHPQTEVYDEHDYEAFEPYYYTAPVADKVVVRNDNTDTVAGTASAKNGYLIQNNPLLKNIEI